MLQINNKSILRHLQQTLSVDFRDLTTVLKRNACFGMPAVFFHTDIVQPLLLATLPTQRRIKSFPALYLSYSAVSQHIGFGHVPVLNYVFAFCGFSTFFSPVYSSGLLPFVSLSTFEINSYTLFGKSCCNFLDFTCHPLLVLDPLYFVK